MRTTLNLNDELFLKASEASGITEKTALIHLGLELIVKREAAKRLIAMGGTMKDLKLAPRNKRASHRK
jgi:hypothetical protein